MPLYYFTAESPDGECDTLLWFPHDTMALDYAAKVFPFLAKEACCTLIVRNSEGKDLVSVSQR